VRRPPKRESRAPSSPLLTPPCHPSHAGRDARASRRVRLQGARDDENAQGGRDRVAAQGQRREERGRVQAARAGTQEPRGAAAGCGVAARRRGGRGGSDGHARARARGVARALGRHSAADSARHHQEGEGGFCRADGHVPGQDRRAVAAARGHHAQGLGLQPLQPARSAGDQDGEAGAAGAQRLLRARPGLRHRSRTARDGRGRARRNARGAGQGEGAAGEVRGRGPPAQGVLLQEQPLHDQGGPHRAGGDRRPQRRAPRGV